MHTQLRMHMHKQRYKDFVCRVCVYTRLTITDKKKYRLIKSAGCIDGSMDGFIEWME